jgi:hypothetical protein
VAAIGGLDDHAAGDHRMCFGLGFQPFVVGPFSGSHKL